MNDHILKGEKNQDQIVKEVIDVALTAKKSLGLADDSINPPDYEDTRTEQYARNRQSEKNQSSQEQEKETKQGINNYMDSKEEEAENKEKKQKGQGKQSKKEQKEAKEAEGSGGEGEEEDQEKQGQQGKSKGKGKKSEKESEEGSEGEGDGEGEGESSEEQGQGKGEGQESNESTGDGQEGSDGQGKGKGKTSSKNNPLELTKEDIEQAKKAGGSAVQEEFKGIQAGKGFELPEGVSSLYTPIVNPLPTTQYADSKFKSDMAIQLKDWKSGKKVDIRETGQNFNVRSYIGTQGKKSFTSMERKSVKGEKYVFVLDFSGSQAGREKEYKRAMINTAESLDGIGAKLAVFGFGYGDQGRGFYRIKTFEQGKWKKTDSGRIAAMEAGGGTPTHVAYQGINQYVKKNRPDYVITVTDGGADDTGATAEQVKELNKYTKMVAFGISPSKNEIKKGVETAHRVVKGKRVVTVQRKPDEVEAEVNAYHERYKTYMERDLQVIPYKKHFVVDDVTQLPKKLVGLIAPASL